MADNFNPLGSDLFGDDIKVQGAGLMAQRFLVPPFSVLNAREGDWQNRKRAWLSLGIKSEVGRDIAPTSVSANTPEYMANRGNNEGGSIFDPVLCELSYKWFCPPGGQIVDPFSGGSVRGIVASMLGFDYWGCDLRAEQVAANVAQGDAICKANLPQWVCGDAALMVSSAPASDLVFTCPPYFDLEVYSDSKADLSNMSWGDFLMAYQDIISRSCATLKNNRFAVIVIGEIRCTDGDYQNLVGETVNAFLKAGLHYYNEAILVTSVGSLPVRTGKQFCSGRKLGKTHQNLLCFWKGDPRKVAETTRHWPLGEVKTGEAELEQEMQAAPVAVVPLAPIAQEEDAIYVAGPNFPVNIASHVAATSKFTASDLEAAKLPPVPAKLAPIDPFKTNPDGTPKTPEEKEAYMVEYWKKRNIHGT